MGDLGMSPECWHLDHEGCRGCTCVCHVDEDSLTGPMSTVSASGDEAVDAGTVQAQGMLL